MLKRITSIIFLVFLSLEAVSYGAFVENIDQTSPLGGSNIEKKHEENASTPPSSVMDLNGIAAKVEDQIITFEELYREMLPMLGSIQSQSINKEDYEKRLNELQEQILQDFIDRVLIVKEFERQGFQIPDAIFEKELEDYIQSNFGEDRTLFLRYLKAQGKDLGQFRKEFKDRIIVMAFRAKKQRSQSEVSPDKIEHYYNTHTEDFWQEEEAHLFQITLNAKEGESASSLLSRAQKIIADFQKKGDFASIALSYNQDYDMGWVQKADMIPELSKAAFALEKGQCTSPISVHNNLFILYLKDKKLPCLKTLDQVREEVEFIVSRNLARENIQRWLESLRKKAFIKKYI